MTTVSVTLQDTKSVVVIPESTKSATVYQKGDTGKSAYQSYLDTTEDDPVFTEAQWAAGALDWLKLTQAEYDALEVKQETKLYIIVG